MAAHKRFSAFENELADNERLQRDRRHDDETRQGEEIETAIEEAFHMEAVAAYALLDITPTTVAGVIALLTYGRDHDDANDGMGWPDSIGLADEPGARSWEYFVIDIRLDAAQADAGVGMKEQSWHRRHAIMLASQLPENPEDAVIILRLANQLVSDFLTDPEPTQKPTATIVRIGGNECA